MGSSLGESPANTMCCALGVHVDAKTFGQHQPRRAQLVPIAKPAVDVDAADLGRHAGGAHQRHDVVHGGGGQRWHVFAEVDGQVVEAAELV
jgi:hypothetical protein